MAKLDPNGIPLYAVSCWVDNLNLYVAMPVKDGPPYITKHPTTEAALSKALSLCRDLYAKAQPTGGHYSFSDNHPIIKRQTFTNSSPEDRAAAAKVLRRLGLIPQG